MDERKPWDRREGETTRAYAVFREFRDLGPTRTLARFEQGAHPTKTVRNWSQVWDWSARATAWDDAVSMIDDEERLDALRNMHRTHQIAARAALAIALAALDELDPHTMSATEIARLMDLGTKLERLTLTQSVADLTGQASASDDPWERIARELSTP
jgi:hypothetical protein